MKLRNLRIWIWLSNCIALLVTISSISGIFDKTVYAQETRNWATQAVGQDIANLIVVPILLISTFYLSKESFRAILVWFGTYIYLFYAFTIYAFFVHFNYLFLVYVAILGLSVYIPVGALLSFDFSQLRKNFDKNINIKPASLLLLVIGIMFGFLWLSEIIPHIFLGTTPISYIETGLWTNPVHVLDLGIVLPAMIITSIMLWKRKLLGYFLAVPLLTFSATMGAGIIALFALLSLNEGGSIPSPAYIVGTLVMLSVFTLYCFLNSVKS